MEERMLSRATQERLTVLDGKAADLERRIKHVRCCPSPHRVGHLVHEWRLIQDIMIRIENVQNFG